jgi:hypothetical protein
MELSKADPLSLSDEFVKRLQTSYQVWNDAGSKYVSSDLWSMITAKNIEIHLALLKMIYPLNRYSKELQTPTYTMG